MGESIHTTRQNREALLVTSKEIGLEVHAEKTKYIYLHGCTVHVDNIILKLLNY